jgi:hypothetical protein
MSSSHVSQNTCQNKWNSGGGEAEMSRREGKTILKPDGLAPAFLAVGLGAVQDGVNVERAGWVFDERIRDRRNNPQVTKAGIDRPTTE